MITTRQCPEESPKRKERRIELLHLAMLVAAAMLALGSPTTSYATDYYLHPDGNDANCTGLTDYPYPGGTNVPCAWATLNKCGQILQPGDRCLVTPGTYRGQRNAGFFNNGAEKVGSPFAAQCTFTQGSKSATCANTDGINPGDWVFGVSGASGDAPFNWTRVQSKTATTLTLSEGYRGPTVPSTSVRVARMIEVVGLAASPNAAVFSNWFDPPASINWQLDATYGNQNVWYYSPTDIPDSDTSLAAAAWRGKFCSGNWTLSCTSDTVCANAGAGVCRIQANGFRDLNLNWDTYFLPITNGREGYIRLGSVNNDVCYNEDGCRTAGEKQRQNCPAGDGAALDAHRFNVSTVPGSYTYDVDATARIYVHLRKVCSGGNRAGYNCLKDSDCFGGTCEAGPPPGSRSMQAALYTPLINSSSMTNPIFDAQGKFVVVRNLTFEGGFHEAGGGGTIPQEVISVGGSNSLYSNLHVWQGQVRWFMTEKNDPATQIARTQFEHIKALSGSTCAESGDKPLSGIRFYDVEMRGTKGQLFNCGAGFRGAADDDPVVFDRFYAHRNYPTLNADADGNGATCITGNAATWDLTTQSFVGSLDYVPGHGVFWGNQGASAPICNVTVQNSVFEMTGGPGDNDSLTFFGVKSPTAPATCHTNKLLFSTFVNQVDPNNPAPSFVSNRSLGVKIGSTAPNSAMLITNGNAFLSEWNTDTAGGVISRPPPPPLPALQRELIPTAEYNRYVFPKFPAETASSPGSIRIWNVGETLKALREAASERREVTSMQTCLSGCGANENHLVSTEYYLEDPFVADGTVSNLNPKAGVGNLLVDIAPGGAGNSSGCPPTDFLGNARADGLCDAGAIERCTPVACTNHCGTTVPDGCGGFIDCGPCNPKPGFANCRSALEVNKAYCGDSMICSNSANSSFQNCLLAAGLTGIFKPNVVLIGSVASGYPSSMIFQVNNTSGTAKPGRVTILNGATDNQLTVSTAQIRQSGAIVYDSPTINPSVSWGETTVTLQPGLNTFTIDNLTDRFGALSVFVSEEALTP